MFRPLNFNLRAVFYYVKKRRTDQKNIAEQVNESLHFIQKYMEGIVPGRPMQRRTVLGDQEDQ